MQAAGGTVPGDVTPLNTAGGDGAEARRSPRHAAPRKSLLTKLQIPAGKAMALAAMPTAVFVGMGLAPKLALADDKDIPFAPGPCVTRSDEPSESESPSPSDSAKPADEASDESSDKKTDEPSSDSSGNASDSEGDSDKTRDEPEPAESPSASEPADETDEADKPAEESEPSDDAADSTSGESKSLLDPLGIGDKIKDLFDGSDDSSDEESETEPAASETAEPADEPSDEPTADQPEPDSTSDAKDPARDEADQPDEGDESTEADKADETDKVTDKTAEAIKDAADKAGAEVEELDDEIKGTDPVKDEDIPDGAKPRFPCPTADPEALAAAEVEPGIPSVSDDPWVLESSKLTLSGLDYKGIVEVRTGSGKIKKALKFTASSIDIKDLHQSVAGPGGTTMHVEARKGSTSEIRNGTVTMYTEELKGKLFGIIPVTFSPESPPPLNVPLAIFTDVKVIQAAQFGGTLTVPGLHNYFTGGNAG
ncbi:hypothetical protein [Streptomyces sp. NPDC127084]|uniref:hypothetical protein n=1 Tax=Streptomyces sp. NPDC127084 TaxID=3347133 RepID=UPI0036611E17